MVICYRYRLLPRKSQHRALERILESQRQLYNAALEERIGAYRKAGLSLAYFDQSRGLTEWRRGDPEATELPVNLQRATLKRLDNAYKGFFRRVKNGGMPGFPRFRGSGWFDSFGFRQFAGIILERGRLYFKGMPGSLRVHWHRELPEGASIKSCTFKRDPKGWCVSFVISVKAAAPRSQERAVGIDLGISIFAAFSDGGFVPSLKAARKAERRLAIAQRALARKARRSGGWRKSRIALVRVHAAVARRRREHLHQTSARLIRDYDVIVVERLSVKGLARSALAKDVHDVSWAKFILMLRYKAERAGARLIEVNPRNTSQECSGCGMVVAKSLGERRHVCPCCGLSTDRDLNAARNVLNRAGVGPGLRNVAGFAACVQART